VRELKAQHAGDLVIYGHGRLAQTLLAHGLTDEIRFNLHPIIAGTATPRLLSESTAPLTLVGSRTRPSGVVLLTYRPAD
jgi:dihydrofolate reductase